MLNKLWQQLMLYLRLGVVDGEGDPPADEPPADDPPADDAPADDDPLGDDLDSLIEEAPQGDERQEVKPSRANEAIRAAKRRAQEAEEARIRAEERANMLERQSRQQPQENEEQRRYKEEEAKLRDPNTTPLERWQIESSRTIRAQAQDSRMARLEAADTRDKMAFDRLEISNPKVYARYSDKVEELRQRSVANGNPIDRMVLLKLVIGDDAISGKLKSTSTARKKAEPADGVSRVNRGQSPGARSDVAGRGRMSDAQKRAERLKGVAI